MDVVIEIGGRLGNVLFQLAQGYEYAKNANADNIYVYPTSEWWFENYKTYSDLHFFPIFNGSFDNFITLREHIYMWPTFFPLIYNQNVRLGGCFESEDFHPKDLFMLDYISKIQEKVEKEIIKKYDGINDSVGISIRRGDYMTTSGFIIPDEKWYLDMYHKYFDGRNVLVFSDDIEWCKSVFKNETNFRYQENVWNEDHTIITNALDNLYLMATCRDHICSCSTYSWWGCKLFEKDGAVNIFHTPRFNNGRWELNYIPSRWIKEPCNV